MPIKSFNEFIAVQQAGQRIAKEKYLKEKPKNKAEKILMIIVGIDGTIEKANEILKILKTNFLSGETEAPAQGKTDI